MHEFRKILIIPDSRIDTDTGKKRMFLRHAFLLSVSPIEIFPIIAGQPQSLQRHDPYDQADSRCPFCPSAYLRKLFAQVTQ